HQLSDRILPLCRLPDEDHSDERTTGRGRKLGEEQEAADRLRELHVGPEPMAEYADAVSGRQRTSCEHALRQETPRQQRRRQRCGKKQRSEEKAAGRERMPLRSLHMAAPLDPGKRQLRGHKSWSRRLLAALSPCRSRERDPRGAESR